MIMIAFAAALGGLSPFCSCGVIPLIAALLAMGVPLSAVMAFWLASPVIDPSMFVLTSGVLGFEFAVAKTAAAIGLGLFGDTSPLRFRGRALCPIRCVPVSAMVDAGLRLFASPAKSSGGSGKSSHAAQSLRERLVLDAFLSEVADFGLPSGKPDACLRSH